MSLHGYAEHKKRRPPALIKKAEVSPYFKIKSVREFFEHYEHIDVLIKIGPSYQSVYALRRGQESYDIKNYLDVLFNYILSIRGYIKEAKCCFEKGEASKAFEGLAQMLNFYMQQFVSTELDEDAGEARLKYSLTSMSEEIQKMKNDINKAMPLVERIKAAPIYILR